MSRPLVERIMLSLVLTLSSAVFGFAQDATRNLHIEISTSGRPLLEELLDIMATRAGVADQLSRSFNEPLAVLRDFCRNTAPSPQLALAIVRMQSALAAECAKHGATDIAEVELARNALILAVRSGSALTGLTTRQVYLAIARDVPYHNEFTRNTAVRWSDVDPSLPPQDIRFQLPMRDESSRVTFNALVLEGGCRNEAAVRQVFSASQRTARCVTVRSDRVREMPPAQSVKALLDAPVGTVGVLSQRELSEAHGQLIGLTLDGIPPNQDAIESATYDFSSSIWLYAKRGSPAADAIVAQALSDAVTGPGGPLQALGLIPMPAEEREAQREAVAAGDGYGVKSVLGWLSSTAADAWHMVGARIEPMPPGMANEMNFTSLMDLAGYQITGIESSIGIIPDATMTFGMAREMSDADRQYLERLLYRDSFARPGAIAAVQRRIVHSILGVREVGGFEVSKVEVDFLPLPKVSLTVTPKALVGPADQGSAPSADDGE